MKKILLIILDGFGIGENSDHNAIHLAKTPNFDRIMQKFPNSKISTSGPSVGLPDGQMGNSEVGHMAIGCGRSILQDLPQINEAFKDGSLENSQEIKDFIKDCKKGSSTCHLFGICSDGGVHGHINHLMQIAEILGKNQINIKIHAVTDGRDTGEFEAVKFLEILEDFSQKTQNVELATVSGRFYAMDRDQRLERTNAAFENMLKGSNKVKNLKAHIKTSYDAKISDEFIKPASCSNFNGFKNGDAFFCCNFRADRIRQIWQKILQISDNQINFSALSSFRCVWTEIDSKIRIIFKNQEIKNCLSEIFAKKGYKQLKVAETEKYAHVTFFFNGGREEAFENEDRILIPSPKVQTYDLKPEMSTKETAQAIINNYENYDLITANFAAADMVGHTGKMEAAIKAVEKIDEALGEIIEKVVKNDGICLITADHGNVESMMLNGKPNTAHTLNEVPLILICPNFQKLKLDNGSLLDVAPTILSLAEMESEKEMSGKNLIIKKQ